MTYPHRRSRFARVSRLAGFLLCLSALAFSPHLLYAFPPNTPDAPAAATVETAYFGLYLANGKLGSATVIRDAHATLRGKPAVRVQMAMTMDLKAFGAPTSVETKSVNWSDPATGAPLETTSHSVSAGRVSDVTVTYTDHSLTYSANVQGSKKTETLTLKPNEHFLIDPSDGANIQPKAGMKLKGKIFSSETLALVDGEVEVLPKETVIIDGQAVQAFKILEKNPLAPSTVWESDAGDLLRVDMPLGMQMLRQPKEIALAPPKADGAAPDLVSITSIVPTGQPLTAEARRAESIVYRISGVSKALPPNDAVQSITASGSKETVDVMVHPPALPNTPAATRFASADKAPERLRKYLSSTVYIPCTDPQFTTLAKEVVGTETDTAKASALIAAYVHKTITADPGIGALRTAPDILKEPRGVCRDYTTLFTAISRAAGIPTKQCVGLGFGRMTDGSGRFIGHAWPEVWVGATADGKDRWVALEPTWGEAFADPTHIKLAEGEITDFFTVAADLARYKIEVLKIEAKP